MKHVLLALTVIFLLGALDVSSQEQIRATYNEPIYDAVARYDFGSADATSSSLQMTVLLERLPVAIGTQRLSLKASDARRNPSIHEINFNQENALGMTLVSPGSHGVAKTPSYTLAVATQEPAECTWKFYSSPNSMGYQDFQADGNIHRLPYSFGERYRFNEGEYVPVHIVCSSDEHTQNMVVPIGWTSSQLDRDSFEVTRSPARTDRQQGAWLTIESSATSSCTLESEDNNYTSEYRTTHQFDDVVSKELTVYDVTCTNAHGSEVRLAPYAPRFANINDPLSNADQGPEILLHSPTITRNQQYQLIIETSTPSTCTQTFLQDQRIPAYKDAIYHQRSISLQQGANEFSITCVGVNDQETTQDVTITRSPPIPTLSESDIQAYQCEQETRIEVSGETQGIEYLKLQSLGSETEVLRAPSQQLYQYGLTQPQGAFEVLSVDFLGRYSSVGTIEVQEEPDETVCGIYHSQFLSLEIPTGGQTQEDLVDIQIQSEYPSTCQFDLDGQSYTPQRDAQQTRHTLTDAHEVLQRAKNELLVTCEDQAGRETTKEFDIYWQLPPPEITVTAQPETITSYTDPTSNITVQADQDVRCTIDGKEPYSEFGQELSFEVALQEPNQQTFIVACENVHGTGPVIEEITLYEEFPSELFLTIQHEEISQETNFEFSIHASKKSLCELTVDEETQEMQSTNSYDHRLTKQLSQGSYDWSALCREIASGKEVSVNSTVIIDTTAPKISLASSQLTCGLDKYTVYGNASDETGIDRIELSFAGKNETSTKLPVTFRRLGLTQGETYSLQITMYDIAGNSATASDSVKASTADDGSCDTDRPMVKLLTTATNQGANLRVLCEDNFACADAFKLSIGAPGGSCELEEYTFPEVSSTDVRVSNNISLTNTSQVCYEVYDESENVAKGTETISVKPSNEYPDACFNEVLDEGEEEIDCGGDCAACQQDTETLCSNGILDEGETGIDCGGVCGKCDVGVACEIGLDCQSLVCASATCAQPTCEDNQKNGDETGKDCGGSCDACSQGSGCILDSDCDQGLVCSNGYCATETLDRDTNPNQEEPAQFSQEEESGGFAGILLIILGALSVIGGGGYIYYEKEQESGSAAQTRPTTNDMRGDVLEHAKEQSIPDFATSKLREEARSKKKQKRRVARNELLGEFDQEPEEPEPVIQESSPQEPEKQESSQPENTAKEDTPSVKKQPEKETSTSESEDEDEVDVFSELEELAKKK